MAMQRAFLLGKTMQNTIEHHVPNIIISGHMLKNIPTTLWWNGDKIVINEHDVLKLQGHNIHPLITGSSSTE